MNPQTNNLANAADCINIVYAKCYFIKTANKDVTRISYFFGF